MAIVKFAPAGSPLNNIFDYVMRDEATEDKLISGVNCSPESALDAETAHEIGLKFAEYFPGFQIVVATHVNTNAIQELLCKG